MLLTLLSAIFGGALRLAPELLKFLGQKDQDAHELAMQDKQYLFLQLQGKLAIDEAVAQGNITIQQQQIQAIQALNQVQANMAIASGKFVAGLNSLVRPLVTFYIFGLWGAHEMASLVYAYHLSGDSVQALMNTWTADDAAMLSMIASFYFVGRAVEKNNGQA